MKPSLFGQHQTVSDPELLAQAIPGARLAPCQLDPEASPSQITRYLLPETHFLLAHLGPRMTFQGQTAQDRYTLIFVDSCPEPGHSFNFGIRHGPGYLGLLAPGATMDSMTPPNYGNAILSVQRQAFLSRLAALYPETPSHVLEAGAALRPSAEAAEALRRGLQEVTRVGPDPSANSTADFTVRFEAEILSLFLDAFADGCDQRLPSGGLRLKKRFQRLRQVREFIEAHFHQTLPMETLCRATGFSKRGLELLFQDLLDVTPTTYLRQLRLHKARQSLRQAPPQAGLVKKIAFACGFTHLGRFAQDYRRQFGESPVDTLSRH